MSPGRALAGAVSQPGRAARWPVRVMLTPAGAGVFALLFPGLLIATLARHRLLMVIGVGAGLLLTAELLQAALTLRRVSATVRSPELASAGEPVELLATVDGGSLATSFVSICALRLGEHGEWRGATLPAVGPIATGFERSVVDRVDLAVRATTSFGLVDAVRTCPIELDPPIVVAPAPVATPIPPHPVAGSSAPSAGGADDAGLRRYRPGDLRRNVHWPSVARTGILLVRDLEAPTERSSVVDLSVRVDDPAAVDVALGRARSTGEALLAAGHGIRLWADPSPPASGDARPESTDAAATRPAEPAAPLAAVVGSRFELARELALLDVRSGAAPTSRPPSAEAELQVDQDGARWRSHG